MLFVELESAAQEWHGQSLWSTDTTAFVDNVYRRIETGSRIRMVMH